MTSGRGDPPVDRVHGVVEAILALDQLASSAADGGQPARNPALTAWSIPTVCTRTPASRPDADCRS